MADKKPDYYTEWLGIEAGPRPPDHYALLGVPRFEADPKKISDASAARLRLVRQYGLKYPKESTDLLNEIAAAEVCLLDAKTKAKYDEQLRAGPVATTVEPATVPTTPAVLLWYLQRDNQVYGPFPDHQLREMARSGYVAADDLVWNEQLARWVAARTVEGLVFKSTGASRGDDEPAPDDDEGSVVSTLEMYARRFKPYHLRDTRLTPREGETLTEVGVNDRTERMFAAWRQTTLGAVATLCLAAFVWTGFVAVLESELIATNWLGAFLKILRVLAFFALPASAIVASILWYRLSLSRWILQGGWLIATATPFLIALIPASYLYAPPAGADADVVATLGGAVQYFRLLVVALALTPAAIRAGLWYKSLRPGSPIGAWSIAGSALAHVLVYWIAFAALCQMFGHPLLVLAAVFFIAGPLVYPISFRWLLQPTGNDVFRRILTARGIHLFGFALGLILLGAFISLQRVGPGSVIRLVGIDFDTSLLRPGTMLQLVLEFLARSFFTSMVAMDLLEWIRQMSTAKAES